MCRVLAYLGEPILLDDLLYQPDVSFVNQTHQAVLLHRLNLAGCGLLAWDSRSEAPETPYTYRTTGLAIYDRNLRSLARKIRATALLAHLRGVAYDSSAAIGEQNLHPFLFDGVRLALAHNGQLARFEETRYALLPYMKPELVKQVRGSTDSEWFYALLLSQLDDPTADLSALDIARGVEAALRVVQTVRKSLGIRTFSPMNLFLSDGNDLVAACFTEKTFLALEQGAGSPFVHGGEEAPPPPRTLSDSPLLLSPCVAITPRYSPRRDPHRAHQAPR